MKWFLTQSIWTIALSFLLGTVLTWLYFRNRYRRVERSWTTQDDDAATNAASLVGSGSARDVQNADPALRTVGARSAASVTGSAEAPEGLALAMGRADSATSRVVPASTSPAASPAFAASESSAVRAEIEALRSAHSAELTELVSRHSAELSTATTALGEREMDLAASRDELARHLSATVDADAEADLSRHTAALNAQALSLRTDHDATLAAAAARHEEVLAELRAGHEQEISGLTANHQAALGGSVEGLAAAREEGDRAAADLRHRAETAETELGKARAELAAAQSTIEERASALDAGRTELARLRGETESVRAEAAREVDAARVDAAREIEAAKSETVRLQTEIEQIRTQAGSFTGELDQARTELESARTAAARSSAEVETLRGELATVRTDQPSVHLPSVHVPSVHLPSAQTLGVGASSAAVGALGGAVISHVASGEPHHLVEGSSNVDDAERAGEGSEPMSAARHLAPTIDGQEDTTGIAGAADDLERIEGIGPRICASLHAVGIRSFDSLAGSSQERLRDALEQAGLNYAPSLPSWPEQAQLLATGNVAGFHELKERLIAGRDAR